MKKVTIKTKYAIIRFNVGREKKMYMVSAKCLKIIEVLLKQGVSTYHDLSKRLKIPARHMSVDMGHLRRIGAVKVIRTPGYHVVDLKPVKSLKVIPIQNFREG